MPLIVPCMYFCFSVTDSRLLSSLIQLKIIIKSETYLDLFYGDGVEVCKRGFVRKQEKLTIIKKKTLLVVVESITNILGKMLIFRQGYFGMLFLRKINISFVCRTDGFGAAYFWQLLECFKFWKFGRKIFEIVTETVYCLPF